MCHCIGEYISLELFYFVSLTSSCSLDHGLKALVFLIVLYVLSYRWVKLFYFVSLTTRCSLIPTGFVTEVWTYSLPLLVVMLGSCRNSVWSLWLCKVTALSVLCSLICHSDVFMYRVYFFLSFFGGVMGVFLSAFFSLPLPLCLFFFSSFFERVWVGQRGVTNCILPS